MYDPVDLEINISTYDWCIRAFSVLQKRLGLNIKFHREDGQADAGQIFLFNHFARFETLTPSYLIHAETGAYCRCVATKELFAGGGGFTRFLMGVGAVPNDLPGLLPFLAAETLRGRKVIVFPEGGMVKDRRSIDSEGRYGVYSRTAGERRKHHAGAAVIALFWKSSSPEFSPSSDLATSRASSDGSSRWEWTVPKPCSPPPGNQH